MHDTAAGMARDNREFIAGSVTPIVCVRISRGLSRRAADDGALQQPSLNTLGIRQIAIAVEDIDPVVVRLKKRGTETFSEVERFDDGDTWCFVRGPKGMIIELEEQATEATPAHTSLCRLEKGLAAESQVEATLVAVQEGA